MLFTPPSGSTDPNASYRGKDVPNGIQGSRVPPGAIENPQRELMAIINAGQASGLPAGTNSDLAQALKAIRSGLLGRFLSSGTPDAIVIAPQPVYTGLVEGMRFRFKVPGAANATNGTTSPTFQVNAIAALAIKTRSGAAPATGDLVAGAVLEAEIWADGTARIMTALASDGGGASSGLGGYTGSQLFSIYTGSGTHTWRSARALIWQAGGGAGGNTNLGGGAGGGLLTFLSGLTPGNTANIGIGVAGTGSTGTTGGGNGGDTVISPGTQSIPTLTAGGGKAPVAGSGNAGFGGQSSGAATSVLMQGNGGTTGIGGIAQPFAPYGNGGSPAMNGVVINGAAIANQGGAPGIAVVLSLA